MLRSVVMPQVDINAKVAWGLAGDGSAGDGAKIRDGLLALPAGKRVFFPTGYYRSPGLVERSDITIIGEAMPSYAADGNSLIGGACFRGYFGLSGDNIFAERIGVDAGNTVAASIGQSDGFAILDAGLSAVRKNVHVRDVVGLCADGAAYHAVLLQSLQYCSFRNVWGRGGNYGIVIKASDGFADGLHAFKAANTGIYIKSDSYAPCNRLNLSNLYYDDMANGAQNGISFYAALASMGDVNAVNLYTSGGQTGVSVVGATRATYPTNAAAGINLCNVNVKGATSIGANFYGALIGTSLSNANVQATGTGKALKVWDDALGVRLADINAAVATGAADAVYLGGRVYWDNVTCTIGGDMTQPSGITVKPDATYRFSVGNYHGSITYSTGVTAGLKNGWTVAFSDTPRVSIRNRVLRMSGRIAVPTGPWTSGMIVAYQLPVAPQNQKNIVVGAYDMVNDTYTSVACRVDTGGQVIFDGLTDTTQFPTAVMWVGLNGVCFDLDE